MCSCNCTTFAPPLPLQMYMWCCCSCFCFGALLPCARPGSYRLYRFMSCVPVAHVLWFAHLATGGTCNTSLMRQQGQHVGHSGVCGMSAASWLCVQHRGGGEYEVRQSYTPHPGKRFQEQNSCPNTPLCTAM